MDDVVGVSLLEGEEGLGDDDTSTAQRQLATAQAHYDAFLKDSQLDDREGHDKDDIAASRENADLAAAFDAPVHAHHAKIDVIENTDFSLTDTVQPGAVIKFNNRRFVVCVSTTRFDVDGNTYMGISMQSPIYLAMAGLQARKNGTSAPSPTASS